MKNIIISIISMLGAAIAATSTMGCVCVWIDEPVTPSSLIEK
ncbi:MAG: hypothetical protein RSA10_03945 [Bacilli bacterium]